MTGARWPGLATDLLVVNGNPLDNSGALAQLDGDRIATLVCDVRSRMRARGERGQHADPDDTLA